MTQHRIFPWHPFETCSSKVPSLKTVEIYVEKTVEICVPPAQNEICHRDRKNEVELWGYQNSWSTLPDFQSQNPGWLWWECCMACKSPGAWLSIWWWQIKNDQNILKLCCSIAANKHAEIYMFVQLFSSTCLVHKNQCPMSFSCTSWSESEDVYWLRLGNAQLQFSLSDFLVMVTWPREWWILGLFSWSWPANSYHLCLNMSLVYHCIHIVRKRLMIEA